MVISVLQMRKVLIESWAKSSGFGICPRGMAKLVVSGCLVTNIEGLHALRGKQSVMIYLTRVRIGESSL